MAAKLRPRVMLPRRVSSKAARAAEAAAVSFSGLLCGMRHGSYRRTQLAPVGEFSGGEVKIWESVGQRLRGLKSTFQMSSSAVCPRASRSAMP
jgi:hypothetical protein